MTWYTEQTENPPATNRGQGDHERDSESRDITANSDADDTKGKYSEKEPISFEESRAKAKTSQEARASRGETLEDSPLLAVTDTEEMEGSNAEGAGDPSSDSAGSGEIDEADDLDARELGEVLRGKLDGKTGIEQADTIATGKTHSTAYEFVETTVRDEPVYAMIKARASGVAYQKVLGNYGSSLSTPSVMIDTDVIRDAVDAERKHQKRQTRYQSEPEVVSELNEETISEIAHYYRTVATDMIKSALLASNHERIERDISVSVVEDCVVVTGEGVTNRLADDLGTRMSEMQLRLVMNALPEAVEQSDDWLSDSVRSEISRVSTLSGECVVADRLLLD